MASTFEFHEEAESEFLEAVAWYFDRSEAVGLDFARAVHRAIRDIMEQPDRWPLLEGEIRKYTLLRFPYRILYVVRDDSVVVLAVAHGSRRSDYWRRRA